MNKDNKVNIFIVDNTLNNEELVNKIMRSSGYAAHTTRVKDEEELAAALEKKLPDILLYATGMPLTLELTLACIQRVVKTPVPVIAVTRPGHEADLVKVMRAGARDLSAFDKPGHLELVIKREVTANVENRKMRQLEITIRESERRCQALLDSSRDAIAYIHEGMHIY